MFVVMTILHEIGIFLQTSKVCRHSLLTEDKSLPNIDEGYILKIMLNDTWHKERLSIIPRMVLIAYCEYQISILSNTLQFGNLPGKPKNACQSNVPI